MLKSCTMKAWTVLLWCGLKIDQHTFFFIFDKPFKCIRPLFLNCVTSELQTVLNSIRQSTQNQNIFPNYWTAFLRVHKLIYIFNFDTSQLVKRPFTSFGYFPLCFPIYYRWLFIPLPKTYRNPISYMCL